MSTQVLIGALLALVIAGGSYVVRFLTPGGAVATFMLGVIVFGGGGWSWALPIVTFFLLSSLLSRYRRSQKARFDSSFEKSDRRDAGQVIANGAIPGGVLILSLLYPVYDFYPLYLGALAAATADTWGTEIGVLTKGNTRSVITLKPVEPGTSGGISEVGTMAGAIGGLVIALSGYFWYSDMKTAVVVVLAGMVGSYADSVLGATLQAHYQCDVCGKKTERTVHCAKPATLLGGQRWINNDVVNSICCLIGALCARVLSMMWSP
jgi:uncharacterized protein (TIGR00297 family)